MNNGNMSAIIAWRGRFTRMRVVPLRSSDAYVFEYAATPSDAPALTQMWDETLRLSPTEHARFVLSKGDDPPADTLLPAHLLIGRIHLREGRPKEAVDALKISIWSQDTAAAHVALADAYLRLRDKTAARSEVQRALALDPVSDDAKKLLARIEGGG